MSDPHSSNPAQGEARGESVPQAAEQHEGGGSATPVHSPADAASQAPQTPQPTQAMAGSSASVPPQAPTSPAAAARAVDAPAGPQSATPEKSRGGLSTFLKVSIVLLAGLTIASISLLFIGDFEGKFERVFSTFGLFAVFVLLTALDTRRGQRSEWYAPVALIANAYILGLLLIVIWMTPYEAFGLMFEIFWKSVFVILVTRLVILCCHLLIDMSEKLRATVTRFAFITSVLAVLAGILFTAPVGIEAFNLYIPDLYWKIATAILILTALALSITLLLKWAYGSDEREAARAQRAAQQAAAPSYPTQVPQSAGPAPYRASAPPAQPPALQQPPAAQHPQAPQHPQQELLPWPTFPDGRPLPAGPDGQPDFSALR